MQKCGMQAAGDTNPGGLGSTMQHGSFSNEFKLLKGRYIGDSIEEYCGGYTGDTRSLGCSSNVLRLVKPEGC